MDKELICPYCEREQLCRIPDEISADMRLKICERCGKTFYYSVRVSRRYDSTPYEEVEGAKRSKQKKERANKRAKVLAAITPICEAFNIKDFDYIIDAEKDHERLKLNDTLIGCAGNSVSAIVDEVIGYLFATRFCRNRSAGAFEKQTLNVIKQYWIKERP